VTVTDVKAVLTPYDPATEQRLPKLTEKRSGTVTATPFDVVFRYKTWFRDVEISTLAQDIQGLIVTERPVLIGRPRVTIRSTDWHMVFHMRRWADVRAVRDVLTKTVRP
jgi:hypothetical protein